MFTTPHTHVIKSLLVAFALLFATAACDSGGVPEDLAARGGTADSQMPTSVVEGANATLYIYDGHDFSTSGFADKCVPLADELQHNKSGWYYYLIGGSGGAFRYPLPGWGVGGDSQYRVYNEWDGFACLLSSHTIELEEGTGESYTGIRIMRIVPGRVTNPPGLTAGLRASSEPVIPDDLDMTDYDAVLEHFGLSEADAIRL